MNKTQFFQHLRQLVATDDIKTALQKLRTFLENSPRLNEAILQTSRFQAIQKQIHLGVVSYQEADITKNQIRASLLDFISELEERGDQPLFRQETEKAISIVNSKNIVMGNIQAGGNVSIGDTNITESETSRRLKLLLYFFVPLLAIGGVFFWYKYQQMQTPLYLKVQLKNTTPNTELPDPLGTLKFSADQIVKTKAQVSEEAYFDDIPAYLANKMIRLSYEAKGFVPIDTSLNFPTEMLILALQRNDDFANIQGLVKDEDGQPLAEVAVAIPACCSVLTDQTGAFSLQIPIAQQRTQQRLELSKATYESKSITTPIYKSEIVRLTLRKKG